MVTVSSPTIEKSAALACSRQLASTDLLRSTAIVAFAVVDETTSNPCRRDVTGGFDCTQAAHPSHTSPVSTTSATTPTTTGRHRRRPPPHQPPPAPARPRTGRRGRSAGRQEKTRSQVVQGVGRGFSTGLEDHCVL